MRDADLWLNRYEKRVYQWYGDRAAEHFGLKRAASLDSSELASQQRTKAFLDKGTLRAGVLYYFNARKDKNGHVGFVRLSREGRIEQWHYSSIKGGLYAGDFRAWLKESLYRREGRVELYVVPEP